MVSLADSRQLSTTVQQLTRQSLQQALISVFLTLYCLKPVACMLRCVLVVKLVEMYVLAGHVVTRGMWSPQWPCSFTLTVSRPINGQCTARTRYTPVETNTAWKSCERWTGRARDENVSDWNCSTVRCVLISCMWNVVTAPSSSNSSFFLSAVCAVTAAALLCSPQFVLS